MSFAWCFIQKGREGQIFAIKSIFEYGSIKKEEVVTISVKKNFLDFPVWLGSGRHGKQRYQIWSDRLDNCFLTSLLMVSTGNCWYRLEFSKTALTVSELPVNLPMTEINRQYCICMPILYWMSVNSEPAKYFSYGPHWSLLGIKYL